MKGLRKLHWLWFLLLLYPFNWYVANPLLRNVSLAPGFDFSLLDARWTVTWLDICVHLGIGCLAIRALLIQIASRNVYCFWNSKAGIYVDVVVGALFGGITLALVLINIEDLYGQDALKMGKSRLRTFFKHF